MFPAVPPPKGLTGRSIDCKLKPGWRFDEHRGVFVSAAGETFTPSSLPKKARIVHKVPSLARAAPKALSAAERDLGRYLQVILPAAGGAADMAASVQSWPAIEEAHPTPEISLPLVAPARRPAKRAGRKR
ncbi:MAG TPA: hypothetical protein VJ890_19990 [Vineibacter sp.]|nr:hypothetical protein [Vineibacter sp.]